jgi:hypothetical protein
MSLDFSLSDEKGDQLFSLNITHNLGKMADAAGIYKVLWRPEENGITHAHQCIEPLKAGLIELVCYPTKYGQYNSPNGWGLYEHFVPFVADVLRACVEFPNATVDANR